MTKNSGRNRRTAGEIRKLVAGYEKGHQSRAAYCAEHGLPLTTLDYYRRKLRSEAPALFEVDLHGAAAVAGDRGVAVILSNQRRVEIGWAELSRVPDHSRTLRSFLRWLEEA